MLLMSRAGLAPSTEGPLLGLFRISGPKPRGLLDTCQSEEGRGKKVCTRLLCLGGKTFNPERGKAHEVLTEQNNELTIFNQSIKKKGKCCALVRIMRPNHFHNIKGPTLGKTHLTNVFRQHVPILSVNFPGLEKLIFFYFFCLLSLL